VFTLSAVETSSAARASISGSWSHNTSARYTSHPSAVHRASTRASRALHCSRYQLSSASRWSRASYLSWARPSNSCRRQTKQEKTWVRGSANAEETRAERPQNPTRSHEPGRCAMRDLHGSVAPRSAPS
jgi:hypothetical protein